MGAVTVSIKKRGYGAVGKVVVADVTFSGTYAAGGDTFTASQFEMTTIDAIVDGGAAAASATTGFVLSPDLANNKLRLLGGAAAGIALAESGVGVQTGTVQRVIVYGNNPHV